jgi:hypothetical protein
VSANYAYDVTPPLELSSRDEPGDELLDERPCAECRVLTLAVFLRPRALELPCAAGARVCPACREPRASSEDIAW